MFLLFPQGSAADVGLAGRAVAWLADVRLVLSPTVSIGSKSRNCLKLVMNCDFKIPRFYSLPDSRHEQKETRPEDD